MREFSGLSLPERTLSNSDVRGLPSSILRDRGALGGLTRVFNITQEESGVQLPDPTGHDGEFLYTDGVNYYWGIPMGSGDVVGPPIAVDSNIAEFDGTSGKKIKDGGISHDSVVDAILHSSEPFEEELNFSYGDAPQEIYTAISNKTIYSVRVIVTSVFNGIGSSLCIGDGSDNDRLFPSSKIDLYAIGSYEVYPDYAYGVDTIVRLYITPGGGCTTGAGKLVLSHQS
jgi:hypothetical protein